MILLIMIPLLKNPSAWIPITLSLMVVALWIGGIAMFGVPVREPDEGVGAHLFQIWFMLEVFMITFFAVKWLPRNPIQALAVLALQVAAVLVGIAPVFYFKL